MVVLKNEEGLWELLFFMTLDALIMELKYRLKQSIYCSLQSGAFCFAEPSVLGVNLEFRKLSGLEMCSFGNLLFKSPEGALLQLYNISLFKKMKHGLCSALGDCYECV